MATSGTVELTRGLVALVDLEDFAWLSEWSWSASFSHGGKRARPVAVRGAKCDGRNRIFYMHREILGLEHGDPREGDHINHDTLDNRRSNLRIVTPRENKQYQPSRGGSSCYVGVTWDGQRGLWRAQIQVDGRVTNLGRFATEVEAAEARDDYVVAHGLAHKLNLAA